MKKNKLIIASALMLILCNVIYAETAVVIPFTPGNNVRSDLADILTRVFIEQTPNVSSNDTANVSVVNSVLSEMSITNPNSIDKAKASEIGEKTSSQIIVTGTVQTNSDKKNPYKLLIKCFNLDTGRMEMKTGYIPFTKKAEKDTAVAEDICRDVCDMLIEQVMPNGAYDGISNNKNRKSVEERQREREREKSHAIAESKKAAAEAKKHEKWEATYTELTEEEKILTPKEAKTKFRLENKFNIDITDFDQMQKRYNTIISRAITFDAIGGTLFVASMCVMAGLFAYAYSIDSKYEKIKDENPSKGYKYIDSDGKEYDTQPESGVGLWIGGSVAGPVGGVAGLLCIAFSGPLYLLAHRTANVYRKTTGYKLASFFERINFNTHYDWDNKEVTVAMAIKL